MKIILIIFLSLLVSYLAYKTEIYFESKDDNEYGSVKKRSFFVFFIWSFIGVTLTKGYTGFFRAFSALFVIFMFLVTSYQDEKASKFNLVTPVFCGLLESVCLITGLIVKPFLLEKAHLFFWQYALCILFVLFLCFVKGYTPGDGLLVLISFMFFILWSPEMAVVYFVILHLVSFFISVIRNIPLVLREKKLNVYAPFTLCLFVGTMGSFLLQFTVN